MSGERMNGLRPSAVVHAITAPATPWDRYFSIKALSSYSSLSERLKRSFLTLRAARRWNGSNVIARVEHARNRQTRHPHVNGCPVAAALAADPAGPKEGS